VGTRADRVVEVDDETWYSPELHINLLVRRSDPRTGVLTIGVSGLKREEPPASMFEVPQGYKIGDVTPPPAPPAAPTSPPTAPESPTEPPL